MSSETLHEPFELLKPETKDLHRAISTLMEELEAIDWYQQRADVCTDDELRSVFLHNKNEEIEHAMMTLEWIRRADPHFDENVRTYLLKTGPITAIEQAEKTVSSVPEREEGAGGGGAPVTGGTAGSLGIGSLKAAYVASAAKEKKS